MWKATVPALAFFVAGWFGYNHVTQNLQTTNTRSRQLARSPNKQIPLPRKFEFVPVTDVALPSGACFLACVKPDKFENSLTCHFRQHYNYNSMRKVIIDGETFQIKSPIIGDSKINSKGKKIFALSAIYGEDPRSFIWDGEIYVVSNEQNHAVLMQMGDDGVKHKTELPKSLGNKNLTPVPLAGVGILFIDMQEKRVNSCARTSEELSLRCEPFWKEIEWTYQHREEVDSKHRYHRGGTAGIEQEHGVFVGFGHATHRSDRAHHDNFFWKLNILGEVAQMHISYFSIKMGDGEITDPTSAVEINGEWYLFASDSKYEWNQDVLSVTNRMYHLQPKDH